MRTTEDHGEWLGEARDAGAAWETFQAMASEPAGEPFERAGEQLRVHYDDDDLLLFESYIGRRRHDLGSGYYSSGEPPQPDVFHLSFTRQFGFHTAELEYFGMNSVALQIEFPAKEALRRLPDAQIWGSPTQLQDWVAKVESSPAFGAFAAAEPIRFYALQSDI